MKPHEANGGLNEVEWGTMSYKEKQIFQCWTKYARPTSVTRSESATLARRIYCANSIRPRLHGSWQFLQGKKMARSHPAFTRDRRNWTRFWTAKCTSLGPEKRSSQTCTLIAVQKLVQFRRSCVNARWDRASFRPCKTLSGPVLTRPQFRNSWWFSPGNMCNNMEQRHSQALIRQLTSYGRAGLTWLTQGKYKHDLVFYLNDVSELKGMRTARNTIGN